VSSILCVDDNDRNLRILDELLGEDYDLECVKNGEQALDHVTVGAPSLVLLDVMMPGISGIEVCRELKSDPMTRDIPVILVTARGQPEEQREGKEAGADAYLIKPFDPDVLLDLVETWLPCGQAR